MAHVAAPWMGFHLRRYKSGWTKVKLSWTDFIFGYVTLSLI